MRLKKLIMVGYRSVKGEETLITDDRVTILIGANDHGKSNILAAIQCLNDEHPISPDDRNWDSEESANVELRWHFVASMDLLEKLCEWAPDSQPAREGQTEIGNPPEHEAVQEPLAESEVAVSEAPLTEDSGAQETKSVDQQVVAESVSSETVQDVPTEPATIFPVNADNEIVFARDTATNVVRVVSLPVAVSTLNEKQVLALRPRVELFESPSGNVIDQVDRAKLETPQFEFMQGIFRLAGLWEFRDQVFAQNDTTSRKLKEASTTLTKILNDSWNQGKELTWIFEHTGVNGDNIVIKIEDPAIKGRYTRPSLRSSGFRTYFLLSMIVYARTQNTPSNSHIYLFDEPGTYLHPAAQLDLQRSFEAIADQAQIVYTTHSLFLVSKNYPSRNRVISKTMNGTKIDQKPFTKNWKSVRETLGIMLSNNFLIADKSLLVEGPSDTIYFLNAIKKLKAGKLIDVDLNDVSIVDAGDSQNYFAMAKLMLSEGRSVVALLDGDGGGKRIKGQLESTCVQELDTKKLQIHVLPENKSSEDVFADLATLRSATKMAYEKLIADNIRTSRDGMNLDEELPKIATTNGSTLGKTLEKVTKSWFKPEEKISKLLIAILYEDLAAKDGIRPPELSLSEARKIKELLGLRGEKSQRTGVFEEVQ